MQNVKLTDDFHRQSVENDNPAFILFIHFQVLHNSIYRPNCYNAAFLLIGWGGGGAHYNRVFIPHLE